MKRLVSSSTIEQQYNRKGKLLNDLLNAFEAETTINSSDDTSTLLSKVDAFNSRGVQGRLDLLALLQKEMSLKEQHAIVDIGCGIGGTARYLHKTFGCSVFGVDLTEEYVTVGNYFTEKMLADHRVQLVHASVLNLPCMNNRFQVAWTEHVQMNIEDKDQFYAEIYRVLIHGGRLAFHDVLLTGQQPEEPPRYPCLWANASDCSFLVTESTLQSHIQQAGLRMTQWVDTTHETIEFLQRATKIIAKNCNSTTPSLGVHLLMGSDATTKVQNHLENLMSHKTMTVMGIAVKDGSNEKAVLDSCNRMPLMIES